MKKLVLVMICALLIVVFIALNYLLWDRENKVKDIETLESSQASSSASINALGREIKKLEDDAKLLKDRIEELEKEKEQIQSEKVDIIQDKLSAEAIAAHKTQVARKLAQIADLKTVDAPIRSFFESLDAGGYEAAYELVRKQMVNQNERISLEDFSDSYKKTVKSIKIKSIELYPQEVPGEESRDMVFKVVLEVKAADESAGTQGLFTEGENERYIGVDYNPMIDEWVIASISPVT